MTHFHMKGFALRLVLKQARENSEMAYFQCVLLPVDASFYFLVVMVSRNAMDPSFSSSTVT